MSVKESSLQDTNDSDEGVIILKNGGQRAAPLLACSSVMGIDWRRMISTPLAQHPDERKGLLFSKISLRLGVSLPESKKRKISA